MVVVRLNLPIALDRYVAHVEDEPDSGGTSPAMTDVGRAEIQTDTNRQKS